MISMSLKKNDFVEIEFTGTILDSGEVFDTNVVAEAKKIGLDEKKIKPFAMAVGQKMLPPGFDADLEGKDVGQSYSVELEPEKAFGLRNKDMIKMIPTKLFHEQQIDPQRGMQLSLDGQLVKVLSSDRGRTLIDFNNPLAGKKIKYDYKILKAIEDESDKVNALQDFLFRQKFGFSKKDNKIVFQVQKEFGPVIKMFAEKFKEILGIDIESEIVEKKKAKK